MWKYSNKILEIFSMRKLVKSSIRIEWRIFPRIKSSSSTMNWIRAKRKPSSRNQSDNTMNNNNNNSIVLGHFLPSSLLQQQSTPIRRLTSTSSDSEDSGVDSVKIFFRTISILFSFSSLVISTRTKNLCRWCSIIDWTRRISEFFSILWTSKTIEMLFEWISWFCVGWRSFYYLWSIYWSTSRWEKKVWEDSGDTLESI